MDCFQFCACRIASAHNYDFFCILAVRGYKFHIVGKSLLKGIDYPDTVILGPTSTTELQAHFQLIWSPLTIPHSSFAIFCFCFMFTSLAIMIRCACGEPAPCMDSVR